MNFDRDVAFPNKIRIIDLLNKIANGEEVPKKIKYNDKIFIYDGFSYIYENKTFNEYNRLEEFISYGSDLKDEVEILEEEKKIPEKLEDFDLTTYSRDDEDLGLELHYTGVSNTFNDVYFKINEIIDYLKSKGE